jgi:hypothetical protein
VVAVDAVDMPVMRVVGVVVMRERYVAAALAVGVLMVIMRGVLSAWHGDRPSWSRFICHTDIKI